MDSFGTSKIASLLHRILHPSAHSLPASPSSDDHSARASLESSSRPPSLEAIVSILPLCSGDDPARRRAARDLLLSRYLAFPPESLSLLETAIRETWMQYSDRTPEPPVAAPGESSPSEADWLCFCLYTFHRNGFTREKTLQGLIHAPPDLVLPFVLARLCDWVPQVRGLAETSCERLLLSAAPDTWVNCLALLDRLARNTRFPAQITSAVDSLLSSPLGEEALRRGAIQPHPRTRRHCYQLLLRRPSFHTFQSLAPIMADPDVVIRRLAVELALTVLPGDRPEILRRAAADTFSPIRGIAFESLAGAGTAPRQDLLPFLFDRSASIRRSCQHLFATHLSEEPAAIYRSALLVPPAARLSVVILGLSETGALCDAQLVAPFASHASSRVRRAVLRALGRLGPAGYEEIFLSCLAGGSVALARNAASILLSGRLAPPELIWSSALANPNPVAHRAVLYVLMASGKYRSLGLLLEACASADQQLVDRAVELLSTWLQNFNRSYDTLTPEAARRLADLLRPVAGRLPKRVHREIDSILSHALA